MSTKSIFTTLVISVFFLAPLTTYACEEETDAHNSTSASQSIRLSELYPSPKDGEEEFIELHNFGDIAANLDGWQLTDASGKTFTLSAEAISTTVAAGGHLVVPQGTSKISLNNGGDSLSLLSPEGVTIDETVYEDAGEGESWSFVSGEWFWSSVVTKGEKNESSAADEEATPEDDSKEEEESAVYETSTAIVLSELLPNPTGSDSTDEWVEIFNTGSKKVSLHGWQLTDESTYHTIQDISIAAGEYLVFEISETGINLNNTGDKIYLIDPYNTIVQGTEYTNSTEGSSWAYVNDEWMWTEQPTAGEANIFSESEEEAAGEEATQDDSNSTDPEQEEAAAFATISTFRGLEDGSQSTIEGVVTVLPGTFGSQYFYVQDETAGVQVYSYTKAFPSLHVGDRVRVTGEKSTARGETRIKTTSEEHILVQGQGSTVQPIETEELSEGLEGMLAQINGEVVERSSAEAVIDGLLTVVVKASTGIDLTLLDEGKSVGVVGIVTQYDANYRIQPRANEDITEKQSDEFALIQPAQAATFDASLDTDTTSGPSQTLVLILTTMGLLTIIIGTFLRKKIDERKKRTASTTQSAPLPENQSTIFDAMLESSPIARTTDPVCAPSVPQQLKRG